MNWAEISLRNRYTVFALTLAIICGGLWAKQTLKVSLFPDTAPPLVNAVINCPGLAADDVARNVVKPLEEECATLEGVRKISSLAQEGLAIVKVEFHYNVDVDGAAVDVQNAVSRVKRVFPPGVEEPRVLKFSTSDRPVITLAVTGVQIDPAVVRDLADNEIRNELQLVPGVAAVDVFGGYQRQVNVFLDRDKLEAMNISPDQVIAAIRASKVTVPGGRISTAQDEYLIRVVEAAQDAEELGAVVLENSAGRFVVLRDVARIEDSTAERRSEYRFHGASTIALMVLKKKEANTVEVADAVLDKLDELQHRYPYLTFKVADEDATFTRQVIHNMTRSVSDAMVLATVVILFFLGHLIQSLVVALSMPLTFLGTFLAMKALDMELNLITLSALILSVGIVVDHAIVVVENILRHQEEFHKEPFRAAVDGTAEIMQPLVVGTYTTVVVLVPLLFIGGFAGRIFGPLALTLILAFTISLLVSLTIIPVLTVLLSRTRWRRAESLVRLGTRPWRRATEALKGFYLDVTQRALRRPAPTLGLAALSLVAGLWLLRLIGMEVLPKMDAGAFFIYLQTEPGTSLEQTSRIVAKVEELLAREPAVQRYSSQIGYEPGAHYFGESGTLGVNQAYINVTLTSRKSRHETGWDIQERLRQQIALLPGIDTFVVKEVGGTAIATTRAPIDIRISGPEQKVLTHLADLVVDKLSGVPGASNIYRSWSLNNREIHLLVREERAAELGLTAAAIGTQVFGGLQGVGATTLEREAGRNITVMVQYDKAFRESPRDIEEVLISTPTGARVPLRDVAYVTAAWGPTVITRENLEQSIDVLGFTQGRTFSHVIADIRRALQEVPVPDGYRMAITGEQADLAESFADLRMALVLAIAGIYLLLVAQFRSFVHPVTIMAAIPLVVVGVALALLYAGKAVSLPVLLAFILLAGTVVNNSILLVDYANRAREDGVEPREAVLRAVAVRFRPIMMTALADVAGMLPLALEWSLGAERFSPLAIAVIGGILTATLLTMVVIPVIYVGLAALTRRSTAVS